jgi:hypothetical protein
LAFSDLFSRLKRGDAEADTDAVNAPVSPTKALSRFLAALAGRPAPVLVDLGPVIGANVSFFGEKLGCKIIVEDLAKDIDRHVSERRLAELPRFLDKRIAREDHSVDGIICWDLFDYLDKASAEALARQLVRILREDGLLLAFFNTVDPKHGSEPPPPAYTKYFIVDPVTLQHRPYKGARARQKSFQNRDIQRMFEPLRITDQFLLKSHTREVLFRKTAGEAPAAPPVS